MPKFRETISIDDYVLDVLMRDLIGHDQRPAAFMVYLHLYGQAARNKWRYISASVRTIADATGLSKRARPSGAYASAGQQKHRRPPRSRYRHSTPSHSAALAHGSLQQPGTPKSMNANGVAISNRL